MEKSQDEKRDKFLLLFVPSVTNQSDVFICCSIFSGNLFISIIFLILGGLYFYNSLYTKSLSSIFQLIYTLIYATCGFFLLHAACTQNYISAKISYTLYEINFFVKLILYIIMIIINSICIFLFWDSNYLTKLFALLIAGGIELGIMSYFIFVMYCFLVVSKEYDNDLNRVGAQYQELLKDYKDDKDLKELKS